MSDNLCRIPVRAAFALVDGGEPQMIRAEYRDIPASLIAEKIICAFGMPVEPIEAEGRNAWQKSRD